MNVTDEIKECEDHDAIIYLLVPNFPRIAVGSDGSIWRKWKRGCNRGQWCQMHGEMNTNGYYRVTLQHKTQFQKRVRKYVHSLVLEAFRGPCPPKMECRHLNGNRVDNRLDNLTWGTPSENNYDRVRHGTHPRNAKNRPGENNSYAKLKNKDIPEIRRRLASGEFASQIASGYGVSKWCICNIRQGKTWRTI